MQPRVNPPRPKVCTRNRSARTASIGMRSIWEACDVRYVYLLWHTNPGDEEAGIDEDSKLLGVYSTEEKATDRIERSRALPGFVDQPEGFLIDRYEIDRDEWPEGFVTVWS